MQHQYLFIISPFFSGSTLLAKLLGTSPSVSLLDAPEHEGMKLPGVYELFATGPGFRNGPLPWKYLDELYHQYWDLSKPILVEKGAYLNNAHVLQDHYPEARFILLLRNPYAWCESMYRRREAVHPEIGQDMRAVRWLRQCTWQIHNSSALRHSLTVTYEDVCDRTEDVLAKLYDFVPGLEPMNPSAEFKVHSMLGKDANPITNTNAGAFARLSREDVGLISGVLSRYPDLMARFGYKILQQDDAAAA